MTKRAWHVQVEQVILVDDENVQPQADELRCVEAFRQLLRTFHGPGQNFLPIRGATALLPIGPVVGLVQCERPGKDAPEFHLASLLGRLSMQYQSAQFVTVSLDRKGFVQLVEQGQRLGCGMRLVPSLMQAPAAPERAEAVDITVFTQGCRPATHRPLRTRLCRAFRRHPQLMPQLRPSIYRRQRAAQLRVHRLSRRRRPGGPTPRRPPPRRPLP